MEILFAIIKDYCEIYLNKKVKIIKREIKRKMLFEKFLETDYFEFDL